MRLEVIENGKAVPKEMRSSVLLDCSTRFRARQDQAQVARLERTMKRNQHAPERQSIAIAMLAVEQRLVEAFWTIARQPANRLGPAITSRCGIDYIPERGDFNGYSDAAGGKWYSVAPRPPIPSGREIDRANEALDWLLFVDENRRKLLVAGATSKRGDMARIISWGRLREGMPELYGLTTRTLQGRYREALRIIVTELTLARLAG